MLLYVISTDSGHVGVHKAGAIDLGGHNYALACPENDITLPDLCRLLPDYVD